MPFTEYRREKVGNTTTQYFIWEEDIVSEDYTEPEVFTLTKDDMQKQYTDKAGEISETIDKIKQLQELLEDGAETRKFMRNRIGSGDLTYLERDCKEKIEALEKEQEDLEFKADHVGDGPFQLSCFDMKKLGLIK
jgi:hypothetical protein